MIDLLLPWRKRGLYALPHLIALCGLFLLKTVVTVILGIVIARHFEGHGGYQPAPLAAPTIRLSGTHLPSYWSLERFSVRIHNQGSSNSCVGQTLATMAEILSAERGIKTPFSGGFIWDLVTGGIDEPISYSQAFPDFESGEAPLTAYPFDGQIPGPGPTSRAILAAWPHRIARWGLVSPWDRGTIEAELHDGRPLAVALPIYDSFYKHRQNGSPIAGQSGSFDFWHSMTIVGYTPVGVIIQNSWGPQWGINGRAVLTWDFLARVGAYRVGAYVVAIVPSRAWPHVAPPPPPPFPFSSWTSWTRAHHRHAVSPYWGRHLSWAASVWLRHRSLGGIRGTGVWYGPMRHRRHGYTRTPFAHGVLRCWPDFHTCSVARH